MPYTIGFGDIAPERDFFEEFLAGYAVEVTTEDGETKTYEIVGPLGWSHELSRSTLPVHPWDEENGQPLVDVDEVLYLTGTETFFIV
jgi:hypothetical protein